jgi:hypothetical protein
LWFSFPLQAFCKGLNEAGQANMQSLLKEQPSRVLLRLCLRAFDQHVSRAG